MSAQPDDLLQELVTAPTQESLPVPPRKGVQKIRYTHDAMIDLIIANPAISQNELALHFGYSPSWISQIIACDAFQNRLAERTKELVDPTIRLSVDERFKGLVLRSMEILAEKLSKPSHQIPDQLALRTLEVASRAVGYGAKDTTVKVAVSVDNHLDELGQNLVTLLRKKKAECGVIDVEPE
jgi:hypothetical protein